MKLYGDLVTPQNIEFGCNNLNVGYENTPVYLMDSGKYKAIVNDHIVYFSKKKAFTVPLPLKDSITPKDTYNLIKELLKSGYKLKCEVHCDTLRELLLGDSEITRHKHWVYTTMLFYPDKFDFELKGKDYGKWRNMVNRANKIVGEIEVLWGENANSKELYEHYLKWFDEYHKIQGNNPFKRKFIKETIEELPKKYKNCFSFIVRDNSWEVLESCLIMFYITNGTVTTQDVTFQNTTSSKGEKIHSIAAKYFMYKTIKEQVDKLGLKWLYHDSGGECPGDSLFEHKKQVKCEVLDWYLVLSCENTKKSIFDM